MRKRWPWLTAVATLLLAGMLIAQAVGINLTGSFTREKAAAALMQTAPAAILWLIILLIGFGMKPAARVRPMKVIPAESSFSGKKRAMLYAVAMGLIALGVLNGGMRDVLIKAINICTECIGLG